MILLWYSRSTRFRDSVWDEGEKRSDRIYHVFFLFRMIEKSWLKRIRAVSKFIVARRREGSSEVRGRGDVLRMEIDEFRKKKNLLFPLLGGKKTKRSSSRENENDMGKSVEAKKKKLRQLFAVISRIWMDISRFYRYVCRYLSEKKKKRKKKGIFL